MKVFADPTHSPVVARSLPRTPITDALPADDGVLDFTSVYRRYFDDVERWFRALGAPSSEIEDLAQEVFIVVRRKLASREVVMNVPGWLYTIAQRTWRDHRRRSWFRHLFVLRAPLPTDRLASPSMIPDRAYEVTEGWALARQVLAKMDLHRRVAFVLFEIEGYSGDEIATLQSVPIATVWTRLHKARHEFVAGIAQMMED